MVAVGRAIDFFAVVRPTPRVMRYRYNPGSAPKGYRGCVEMKWKRRIIAVVSMEINGRSAFLLEQLAECAQKAATARTEETRRAWLIAARGWQKMIEQLELKSQRTVEPAANFIPEVDDLLKQLAAKVAKV